MFSCEVVFDSFVTPLDYSPSGSSVHGMSRLEHWRGLPFSSPGDLPNPGVEPGSPASQADSLSFESPEKPRYKHPGQKYFLETVILSKASEKTWSTGEGSGKPLQDSCLENPMNSMKRQNDRILKEELPRSVGANRLLEISGEKNSRNNEEMEPKQKQHPFVDVMGDGVKSDAVKSNIA